MIEFRMPSLGADMDTGRVLKWLVSPGDVIHRGDVILEVETSKANVEVECFADGVLQEVLVPEGMKVPVGTVLATLRDPGEQAAAVTPLEAPPGDLAPAPSARPAQEAAPPPLTPAEVAGAGRLPGAPPARTAVRPAQVTAPSPPPATPRPPSRPRITPLARRMAADRGVDLSTLRGTGIQGAITAADVERAAERPATPLSEAPAPEAPPPEAPAPASDRASDMRRAIAAAMTRSKREIPHYYLDQRIDLHRAMGWLEAENARRPVTERLLLTVLLLRGVALAAREVPEVNGHYVDGTFRPSAAVHLGTAIRLRGLGLVAPALHHVEDKTVAELMPELRDLVARARQGRLRSSELTDGTLTVTHLGDLGVERVFGVIYPPQVAIVGFGRVVEAPWAEHGLLGVRPRIQATLSADHRVSDGLGGARFLNALDRLLQEPEKL